MDEYGEFSQAIANLVSSLSEVRAQWTDQTALTYDTINENMQGFSIAIWRQYASAVELYEMEKKNYDEGEFNRVLNELGARASAV